MRQVAVDEHVITFVLRRSRRRTIGFLINDDGLRVTAPRWVSLAQIDDAVRARSRWILTRMQAWRERQRRLAVRRTEWADGATLPYLGVNIIVRLDGARETRFAGASDAPCDHDILWLGLPADASPVRIRDAVHAWLQQQAQRVMGERLEHFLRRTGLRVNRWRLSSATTRWGSCSSRGNIMLNWRLIHFPMPVIDYVIAHELAHLREMNHGPGFWAEVGKMHPEYPQAREVLRQYAPSSLPS